MGQTLVTKSPSETQKWSERFAKKLRGGDVVALYGELGSGKTTFVQGLSKGLGVRRRVISPTFIIVRTYKLKGQNAKRFYHVDLYRIKEERELVGLGIEEILNDKEAVVAIEWAEKMETLPKSRWNVTFTSLSEERRKIVIFNI